MNAVYTRPFIKVMWTEMLIIVPILNRKVNYSTHIEKKS